MYDSVAYPSEPDLSGAELARRAHGLTADLSRPQPAIYWLDLTTTAVVLYVALAAAALAPWPVALAAGLVGTLALYRALSFIHELTHLRAGEVRGFLLGWHLMVGVPFLTPAFLYDGVHNLHHARNRYGTADDPEYLPLGRCRPAQAALFLGVALSAPLGAFLRFAILAPISVALPMLRPTIVACFSAMTINPSFRRRDVERAASRAWRVQEVACWLWSWALVALVLSGGPAARLVFTGAAMMAGMALLNQLRTLAAHRWAGNGAPMTLAEQLRDSVNIPPPAWPAALWAPVGLRYHALHHLLPRLPYHALGEAHRRLGRELPAATDYEYANADGIASVLADLLRRMAASAKAGR
jgi:fatty acid desaturase